MFSCSEMIRFLHRRQKFLSHSPGSQNFFLAALRTSNTHLEHCDLMTRIMASRKVRASSEAVGEAMERSLTVSWDGSICMQTETVFLQHGAFLISSNRFALTRVDTESTS